MLFTQHALAGGLTIVNLAGFFFGRSGVHRMIRHELPPFPPGGFYFRGGLPWPIPLPEWVLWMWADYNLLIGGLCIVLPIVITIFLIGRERYRTGWFCLLLFTLLVFGTGLSLWLDSILMALSGW